MSGPITDMRQIRRMALHSQQQVEVRLSEHREVFEIVQTHQDGSVQVIEVLPGNMETLASTIRFVHKMFEESV